MDLSGIRESKKWSKKLSRLVLDEVQRRYKGIRYVYQDI